MQLTEKEITAFNEYANLTAYLQELAQQHNGLPFNRQDLVDLTKTLESVGFTRNREAERFNKGIAIFEMKSPVNAHNTVASHVFEIGRLYDENVAVYTHSIK